MATKPRSKRPVRAGAAATVSSTGLAASPATDRSKRNKEFLASRANHNSSPGMQLPVVIMDHAQQYLFDMAPAAIVDPDARLLWVNAESIRILSSHTLLGPSGPGFVMPNEEAQTQFERFARNDEPTGRLIMRSVHAAEWIVVRKWACSAGGRPARILRFGFSAAETSCHVNGIADLFSLTRTETAVLDRFAAMHSVDEIAMAMSISLATVRSHLKRIYGKAGVHNGRELVRLVAIFDMI